MVELSRPALPLVPTGDGQMSLYYIERYGTPSVRIRRAVLRQDGFVSLRADYEGGTITTRPFTFAGSQLTLNYSTSAAGSLRVEAQDAAGNPISGYRLDECRPIFGDELDRAVVWKSGPSLAGLAGRRIRLKFEIKDGDLFSMRFR